MHDPDDEGGLVALTPDELVAAIFAVQNGRNPTGDPGDITIDIQDDSALHVVFQKNQIIGFGGSIQEALEAAFAAIAAGFH